MTAATAENQYKGARSIWYLGTRDPTFIFDPLMTFGIVGALMYTAFGIVDWLRMGISPFTAVAVVFVAVAPALINRVCDWMLEKRGQTLDPSTKAGGASVIGRRAVVSRTLRVASSTDPSTERFYTGLSYGDQGALVIMALLILPALRVFFGVGPASLSLLAGGGLATVAVRCLLGMSRIRFVNDNMMTIESVWRSSCFEVPAIDLKDAQITCDLDEGMLVVQEDGRRFAISLRELWSPHRFVSCVLSASANAAQIVGPAK